MGMVSSKGRMNKKGGKIMKFQLCDGILEKATV